ncbi:unnamed protein product [Colias eurytheme]|nr:unnamed protein product [Colias eurytheme]
MEYRMEIPKLWLVIFIIGCCSGVSLRSQLDHIAKTRAESQGIYNDKILSRRRYYQFDPREVSHIVGVPSLPNHLPEAEPILPGHTLIRPSLGMLKSAIKFPHQELEDGAGVYGNIDNLGIRYDAKNERVLNTGFRRSTSDYIMYLYNIREGINYLDTKEILRNHKLESLSTDSSEEITTTTTVRTVTKDDEKSDKMKWFLNSKNSFDHITVNKNAPDHSEFIPGDTKEKLRQWWFFSQQDYKTFSEEK